MVIFPPRSSSWADKFLGFIKEQYSEIEILKGMPTGKDFNTLSLKLAITGTNSGKIIASRYRRKLIDGTLAEEW